MVQSHFSKQRKGKSIAEGKITSQNHTKNTFEQVFLLFEGRALLFDGYRWLMQQQLQKQLEYSQ